MTEVTDDLETRVAELEIVVEKQAETISNYKKHLQNSVTELTRHFMASVEPSIRKLVQSEVEICIKRNSIKL